MPGKMHPEYGQRPASGRDGGTEFSGEPLFIVNDLDGIWVHDAPELVEIIEHGHYSGDGFDLDSIYVKLPGDRELYPAKFENQGEVQHHWDESGDIEVAQSWTTQVFATVDGRNVKVSELHIHVKDH